MGEYRKYELIGVTELRPLHHTENLLDKIEIIPRRFISLNLSLCLAVLLMTLEIYPVKWKPFIF